MKQLISYLIKRCGRNGLIASSLFALGPLIGIPLMSIISGTLTWQIAALTVFAALGYFIGASLIAAACHWLVSRQKVA